MTQRGRQLVWAQSTLLGNGNDCPHGWNVEPVKTLGSKPLDRGVSPDTSFPLVSSELSVSSIFRADFELVSYFSHCHK